MALPFSTTTITIERPNNRATADGYTPETYTTVATGVAAVVSNHDAKETQAQGNRTSVTAKLHVAYDADLDHYDRITDDSDGVTYEVTGVWRRDSFGISFTEARLLSVTGVTHG